MSAGQFSTELFTIHGFLVIDPLEILQPSEDRNNQQYKLYLFVKQGRDNSAMHKGDVIPLPTISTILN